MKFPLRFFVCHGVLIDYITEFKVIVGSYKNYAYQSTRTHLENAIYMVKRKCNDEQAKILWMKLHNFVSNHMPASKHMYVLRYQQGQW